MLAIYGSEELGTCSHGLTGNVPSYFSCLLKQNEYRTLSHLHFCQSQETALTMAVSSCAKSAPTSNFWRNRRILQRPRKGSTVQLSTDTAKGKIRVSAISKKKGIDQNSKFLHFQNHIPTAVGRLILVFTVGPLSLDRDHLAKTNGPGDAFSWPLRFVNAISQSTLIPVFLIPFVPPCPIFPCWNGWKKPLSRLQPSKNCITPARMQLDFSAPRADHFLRFRRFFSVPVPLVSPFLPFPIFSIYLHLFSFRFSPTSFQSILSAHCTMSPGILYNQTRWL